MRDRGEAIRWLSDRGYVAFARDWSIGESVGIAKRLVDMGDGIQAYQPTLIWIYPSEDGGCAVVPPLIPSQDVPFASLGEAVAYALGFLPSQETA